MSKIASTCSAPWCISPSSAYSRPGMNPSTSAVACASFRSARTSGCRISARSRSNAAANAAAIVGAHHAAAAGQRDRLHDAGIRQGLMAEADGADRRSSRHGTNHGHRQAGVAEPLARAAACGARRPRPPADATAGRALGDARARSPSADRRPRAGRRSDAARGRLEDRRDRRVLVVEPDRNRAGPATDPRSGGTDRSRRRAPPRAARPRRRTRASDSRSSSPTAGHVVIVAQSSFEFVASTSLDRARSANPSRPTSRRSTTEPPALHWAPLNSTRARSGTARSRGRARAACRPRRGTAGALVRERADLVEHAPAIRGQPRADQRHDVALQLVDARIGMRPAVGQRLRRRRRRGARASRRAPAAATLRAPAAGWRAESAPRGRRDRARRSCRAGRSSLERQPRVKRDEGRHQRHARRRGTARPPRGSRRACVPCRTAAAPRRRPTRPRWSRTRSRSPRSRGSRSRCCSRCSTLIVTS